MFKKMANAVAIRSELETKIDLETCVKEKCLKNSQLQPKFELN